MNYLGFSQRGLKIILKILKTFVIYVCCSQRNHVIVLLYPINAYASPKMAAILNKVYINSLACMFCFPNEGLRGMYSFFLS